MGFHMKCSDAGVDCDKHFQAETKEQMMEEISVHLDETHPDLEMTVEQLQTLILTR